MVQFYLLSNCYWYKEKLGEKDTLTTTLLMSLTRSQSLILSNYPSCKQTLSPKSTCTTCITYMKCVSIYI